MGALDAHGFFVRHGQSLSIHRTPWARRTLAGTGRAIMLTVSNLSKSFGDRLLFDRASFTVNPSAAMSIWRTCTAPDGDKKAQGRLRRP